MDENGDRISVLGILLSVLKVLLAEGQPYRDFNLSQLRDIDALEKLLFMCKVSVIYSVMVETDSLYYSTDASENKDVHCILVRSWVCKEPN